MPKKTADFLDIPHMILIYILEVTKWNALKTAKRQKGGFIWVLWKPCRRKWMRSEESRGGKEC